jgi:hypothetical protein
LIHWIVMGICIGIGVGVGLMLAPVVLEWALAAIPVMLMLALLALLVGATALLIYYAPALAGYGLALAELGLVFAVAGLPAFLLYVRVPACRSGKFWTLYYCGVAALAAIVSLATYFEDPNDHNYFLIGALCLVFYFAIASPIGKWMAQAYLESRPKLD